MDKEVKIFKSLIDMNINEGGIISCFRCGRSLEERLNALNIRCGKRIKKVSTAPLKGPIVIEIDNSQIAIGYGMAKKILIEIDQ